MTQADPKSEPFQGVVDTADGKVYLVSMPNGNCSAIPFDIAGAPEEKEVGTIIGDYIATIHGWQRA